MLWLTFARIQTCVVESQSIALLPKQTLTLDPDDREGFTKHAAPHFWPSQHIR